MANDRVGFKPFVPEEGYCRCRHRVKLNEDGSNPCRCCNESELELPEDLDEAMPPAPVKTVVSAKWIPIKRYEALVQAEADLDAARAEGAALRAALGAYLDVTDGWDMLSMSPDPEAVVLLRALARPEPADGEGA